MSIYDNPQEYAKKTFITLEQAVLRCQHFKKLKKEIQEAKKCPKCGAYTLEFESGCYEEGYGDFIYCTNEISDVDEDGEEVFVECGFTSSLTEQFQPLVHWYDFDIILMFSNDIEERGMDKVEKEIGCSWPEFVDKITKEDCA